MKKKFNIYKIKKPDIKNTSYSCRVGKSEFCCNLRTCYVVIKLFNRTGKLILGLTNLNSIRYEYFLINIIKSQKH